MIWKETTFRYVAFFDILGFKEMVFRNSHASVKKKLMVLHDIVDLYQDTTNERIKEKPQARHPVKIAMFSDSLVLFSSDNSLESLKEILVASQYINTLALVNKIPIKGALSYGTVTADFTNSVFFGKAIIDAFLLQDELLLYGAILHHSIEKRINDINFKNKPEFYASYCCPLKLGNVNHLLVMLDPNFILSRDKKGKGIIGFNEISSGHQRKYVDNTVKYFEHIQKSSLENISILKVSKLHKQKVKKL